ncbi:hypothetical protein Bca101_024873 [Brassica carinata]
MEVPTPVVIIDQDSDPDATVVEVTFGDRLGALLDTMNALKNLGLNVVKANVYLDSSGKHNKFAITKAGRKVEDPELLEAIRLTVINNLLEFHPVLTNYLLNQVLNWQWEQLLVYFHQLNRPGILVELVKNITDISVAVKFGEFDTEGLLAKVKFHVNSRTYERDSSRER